MFAVGFVPSLSSLFTAAAVGGTVTTFAELADSARLGRKFEATRALQALVTGVALGALVAFGGQFALIGLAIGGLAGLVWYALKADKPIVNHHLDSIFNGALFGALGGFLVTATGLALPARAVVVAV